MIRFLGILAILLNTVDGRNSTNQLMRRRLSSFRRVFTYMYIYIYIE